MKLQLDQELRRRMEKYISGAISSTIIAHGQINCHNRSSAAKRITSQLLTQLYFPINEEKLKITLFRWIERWQSELIRRRKQLNKKEDINLRAKNKMLSLILKDIKEEVIYRCLDEPRANTLETVHNKK